MKPPTPFCPREAGRKGKATLCKGAQRKAVDKFSEKGKKGVFAAGCWLVVIVVRSWL